VPENIHGDVGQRRLADRLLPALGIMREDHLDAEVHRRLSGSGVRRVLGIRVRASLLQREPTTTVQAQPAPPLAGTSRWGKYVRASAPCAQMVVWAATPSTWTAK
jgi:hypothetical protein